MNSGNGWLTMTHLRSKKSSLSFYSLLSFFIYSDKYSTTLNLFNLHQKNIFSPFLKKNKLNKRNHISLVIDTQDSVSLLHSNEYPFSTLIPSLSLSLSHILSKRLFFNSESQTWIFFPLSFSHHKKLLSH